jgi:hypothetical protein
MRLRAEKASSKAVAVVDDEYCGYMGTNSTRSAPASFNWFSMAGIPGVP